MVPHDGVTDVMPRNRRVRVAADGHSVRPDFGCFRAQIVQHPFAGRPVWMEVAQQHRQLLPIQLVVLVDVKLVKPTLHLRLDRCLSRIEALLHPFALLLGAVSTHGVSTLRLLVRRSSDSEAAGATFECVEHT
eukprot:4218503-Prymnesium_polylepis.1